jgi:hypothetical protein
MIAKRPSVLAFPQSLPIFFCLQAFPFVVVFGLAAEDEKRKGLEGKFKPLLSFFPSYISLDLLNLLLYSLSIARCRPLPLPIPLQL